MRLLNKKKSEQEDSSYETWEMFVLCSSAYGLTCSFAYCVRCRDPTKKSGYQSWCKLCYREHNERRTQALSAMPLEYRNQCPHHPCSICSALESLGPVSPISSRSCSASSLFFSNTAASSSLFLASLTFFEAASCS